MGKQAMVDWLFDWSALGLMVMVPAAKVATVDQKTSPLRLDDRLQAEDGQAEQVHQEGDLHEGGVALEGLRAIQCHVDESKSSILR